jgi:hypothetical protein
LLSIIRILSRLESEPTKENNGSRGSGNKLFSVGLLLARKTPEHPSCNAVWLSTQRASRRGLPNPHPDSSISPSATQLGDRTESVVSTFTTVYFDSQGSERNIDLIVHNNHLGERNLSKT